MTINFTLQQLKDYAFSRIVLDSYTLKEAVRRKTSVENSLNEVSHLIFSSVLKIDEARPLESTNGIAFIGVTHSGKFLSGWVSDRGWLFKKTSRTTKTIELPEARLENDVYELLKNGAKECTS